MNSNSTNPQRTGKKLSKAKALALLRAQAQVDLQAAERASNSHGEHSAVCHEWDEREIAAFNRQHSQAEEIRAKLIARNGGEAVWQNLIDKEMYSGGYGLQHPRHGCLCVNSPVYKQSIPVSFPYNVAKTLLDFFPDAELTSLGKQPHSAARAPGVPFNTLIDGVRYGHGGKLFNLKAFFEEKGLSALFNATYN